MKWAFVGVAAALAVAIAALALLVRTAAPAPPKAPGAPGASHRDQPPARPPARSAPASASGSLSAAPPAPVAPPSLATPADAVRAALRDLYDGRYEDFRATFLPAVRGEVTPEAFAACQVRVRQRPVLPDWEVAEDSSEGGHRVRRVSMFGKSMTGFHEIDGQWLADAVWCLPVGLP